MKFLASLACLVASVSAIDLYFHTNNDCGGSNGLVCSNMNPNTCCGTSSTTQFQSVALRGIPSGWNLQLRGYTNGNCNQLQTISGNNGNNWICNRSNGFRYSGVGWNFIGKKRAEDSAAAAIESEADCQRPDILVLADGTEYDISGLSDDDFTSL